MGRNRKAKAFYFIVTLLTLGLFIPLTQAGTLAIYIAYASSLGSLVTLYFGANVANKKVTENAYIKELEMSKSKEDLLGGTF